MSLKASTWQAQVPDTLDLAERARFGVNALTGVIDPTRGFQPHQCMQPYRNPPVLSPEPGGYLFDAGNEMWGKHAEALLEMRLASGSTQALDHDVKSLRGMTACIGEDGLFYSRPKRVDGETLTDAEEFSDLVGGARVLLALVGRCQIDGGAEWRGHAARLARGFSEVAVHAGTHSYYPDGHMGGAISRPRTGWKETREPLGTSVSTGRDWYECSSNVLFSHGGIVQALCAWHRFSGERAPLDLAGRIARFMLQERFWVPDAVPLGLVPSEHGHFEGHIHATVRGLWGLLDLAVMTNDEWLKAFVRDGYEYVRCFGIPRIGLFGEGCTVGDMTSLAVRLSDAGVGDYWEDVDQYTRNHVSELQILDSQALQSIPAASPAVPVKPWEDPERFMERTTGAMCDDALHPTLSTPGLMFCCTYNGLIGLYHAWESIVRCAGDTAHVNLLLNRASPWLDIDSYLPFEGRVVIRNKTVRRIAVRIPRWVDLDAVKAAVNGRKAAPFWIGRVLVVDRLRARDAVEVTFPMVESAAAFKVGWTGIHVPGWTEVTKLLDQDTPSGPFDYQVSSAPGGAGAAPRPVFTIRFRGNDAIDISPRETGLGYPLYKRDHMRSGAGPLRATMRTVTRVVAPRLVDL